MLTSLKAITFGMLIMPFAAQQDPAANPKPLQREPEAKALTQQKSSGEMELVDDRTVVLVGRVIRKDDGHMVLRVREFLRHDPAPRPLPSADETKATSEGTAGRAQVQRPRTRKSLRADTEIRLLPCALLEDIEQDAELKLSEPGGKNKDKAKDSGKGQDTDQENQLLKTPLLQVQGVLTSYKDEPYIFLQAYRTRTEFETNRPSRNNDGG